MIIFKVSHNFHKGINEFLVENINDELTFNFKNWDDRIISKTFIPKYSNEPTFFIKIDDAKKYIIQRIEAKISNLNTQIINCKNTLEHFKKSDC